jgi:hypothetical protein
MNEYINKIMRLVNILEISKNTNNNKRNIIGSIKETSEQIHYYYHI